MPAGVCSVSNHRPGPITVTLAASAGQLQLNVMEPVITFALFTSIATMEHAIESLRIHCIDGITANAILPGAIDTAANRAFTFGIRGRSGAARHP